MKGCPMTCHPPTFPASRRALAALFAVATLTVACGGGGDDPGVGSGGTGSPLSFAQGPITGFGSIVVDGVHFDDSAASVVDDDGNALSATQSLRLGSVVDVRGGVETDGAAQAGTIRVQVDLVGPVTAGFDAASGRLAVLGQPVRVLSTTALDAFAGGAPAIATGSVVAVSSLYDQATGVYVATRIDPAPGAGRFAIRGAPTAVDAAAGVLRIGATQFAYGGLAPPAAGQLLRAVLAPTPDRQGRWVVGAFGEGVAAPPDGRRGRVAGVVDSATDATHFVVDGLRVDASRAAVTPAGAGVAVQNRVQVQGSVVAGVLVATAVEVDADDDGQDHHGGAGGADPFRIAGPILALDAADQTLTMRGPTTVDYASARFVGGTVADLAVGKAIDVKGSLSADGGRVVATQVRFGH
jgi:hypothetical protein